jgi:hypothetical protein
MLSILLITKTIASFIGITIVQQHGGINGSRPPKVLYNTYQRDPSLSSSSSSVQVIHDYASTTTTTSSSWPMVQKALCGTGTPNLIFSRTLFELARQYVFVTPKDYQNQNPQDVGRIRGIPSPNPSPFIANFYVGSFGISTYSEERPNNAGFTAIYMKLWKCGNNQIRAMEKKLYKHRSTNNNTVTNATYVDNITIKQALGRRYYRWNDTNRQYEYTNANDNNGGRNEQPCIYTAIRDPVSHFLSGYNEVEERMINRRDDGPNQDGNAETASYYDVPYNISDEIRQERFTQFVKNVLLEDPIFNSHFVYRHYMPKSRILPVLSHYNLSLTGYLPTLDNITTTWPQFMSTTCPGFPSTEEIPKMKKWGQHRSSQDELGLYKAAKDVWQQRGPIAKALCMLHAFDYACWTDLPDGIPPICQEVYQNEKFLQRVRELSSEDFYVG